MDPEPVDQEQAKNLSTLLEQNWPRKSEAAGGVNPLREVEKYFHASLPSKTIHLTNRVPSIVTVFRKLYPTAELSDTAICSRSLSKLEKEDTSRLSSSSIYFYDAHILLPLLRISLIGDLTPNAFAFPANSELRIPPTIVLSLGLLSRIENESELAFVLAHEVTHLVEDHFSPPLPYAILTDGQMEEIENVHHAWEFLADKIAIKSLRAAGFSESGAETLLTKLSKLPGQNTKEERGSHYLHKHPSIENRIAAFKK